MLAIAAFALSMKFFAISYAAAPGPVVSGHARFTVITPECVRIEYDPAGKFVDAPSLFAVNRDRFDAGYALTQTPESLSIDTGKIHIDYINDGRPLSPANLSARIQTGTTQAVWIPGAANPGNLGGTIHSLDHVAGPVDLGQGLLSRDGWFLLDDSSRPLLVDDWVQARPPMGETDWYLFGYGQDFKGALKAMTAIGGAVPLPRKYALGAWYSRWWKYDSEDYRKIVQEFHDHDFPLDLMVLDMYWHKSGWTGLSWNRDLLPDAESLMRFFHDENLHVSLNDHPAAGVGPQEDMYADFMRAVGADPATKAVIPYDAGDRKYMTTLFQYAHSAREREGVDFWWLDWLGDDAKPMNRIDWLNELYFRHSQHDGLRGQDFSRWADWGDHRHPVHFSGDSEIGWGTLQFEVPFTATAGNQGAFYWSHDVGGFEGGLTSLTDELMARWAQFGALAPILRLHSTDYFWLDKRPWKFSPDAQSSMKAAFHLRSEIFPYLYSSAWQSHVQSIPLSRPMYTDHPELDEAYHQPQEYELGDAFLVAPIVSPGAGSAHIGSQAVWFPPESDWFQWFTGEKYAGGTATMVAADFQEMPLFARGGYPIAMQPYTQRMASAPLATLVVRAYPGRDGETQTSQLYEDDGVSQDYLSGAGAITELGYARQGETVSLTVAPTRGAYTGQLSSRAYVFELPNTEAASGISVNGAPAAAGAWTYDSARRMNRLTLSARPITEGVKVVFTAREVLPDGPRTEAEAKRVSELMGSGASAAETLAQGQLASSDRDALLAMLGVGLPDRADSPYLYPTNLKRAEAFLGNALSGLTNARLSVIDSAGGVKKTAATVTCVSNSVCAAAAPPLIADGSYPFGLPVTRTEYLEFTLNGHPMHLQRSLGQAHPFLSQWKVSSVFPYDSGKKLVDQRYAPESQDSIDASAWQRVSLESDGSIDLRKLLDREHALVYALTYVVSDADQGMRLYLNSDDGLEVFVDGIRVLDRDAFRSLNDATDPVLVPLKSGRHAILLKIANNTGGWGFRAALETGGPVRETMP